MSAARRVFAAVKGTLKESTKRERAQRPQSVYNIFVKQQMTKDQGGPGKTMAQSAEMWKSMTVEQKAEFAKKSKSMMNVPLDQKEPRVSSSTSLKDVDLSRISQDVTTTAIKALMSELLELKLQRRAKSNGINFPGVGTFSIKSDKNNNTDVPNELSFYFDGNLESADVAQDKNQEKNVAQDKG